MVTERELEIALKVVKSTEDLQNAKIAHRVILAFCKSIPADKKDLEAITAIAA